MNHACHLVDGCMPSRVGRTAARVASPTAQVMQFRPTGDDRTPPRATLSDERLPDSTCPDTLSVDGVVDVACRPYFWDACLAGVGGQRALVARPGGRYAR